MKQNIKISLLLSLLMSLYGCSMHHVTTTSKSTEVMIKPIIPNQLMVDLEVVGVKSTGTSSGKNKLFPLETIKQNAIADALKKTDSDVLIEPIFTVETFSTNVTVSVTGFPAKYVNFRTLSPKDTTLLNVAYKYNDKNKFIKVNQITENNYIKNDNSVAKKSVYALGALSLVGVLVLLISMVAVL